MNSFVAFYTYCDYPLKRILLLSVSIIEQPKLDLIGVNNFSISGKNTFWQIRNLYNMSVCLNFLEIFTLLRLPYN